MTSVVFFLLLTGVMVLAIALATIHLTKKMKQISSTPAAEAHEYEFIQSLRPPLPAPRPPQTRPLQIPSHEPSCEPSYEQPVSNFNLVRNAAYNGNEDDHSMEGRNWNGDEPDNERRLDGNNEGSLVDSDGYEHV